MAVIQWPTGLRGPLVSGFSREEVVGFRDNPLASGPDWGEPFSDDTPQFHNVSYQFKNGDARRFELWLRENKFKFLSPFFDGPLITEDSSILTQECRFTSDGYPQLQSKSVGGIWTYSARLLTREIVDSDDAYATELESMWGVNCGDINLGNSLLDEGLIL
jgi:hypothetical protein